MLDPMRIIRRSIGANGNYKLLDRQAYTIVVSSINRALDIVLTEKQLRSLFTDDTIRWDRQEGKTTAYCIFLALSDHPVPKNLDYFVFKNPAKYVAIQRSEGIDLSRFEMYSDELFIGEYYARDYLLPLYLNISKRLNLIGFETRPLIGDLRRR